MDDRLVDLLERFDERVRVRRPADGATADARMLAPESRRELAEAVKCLRLIARVRRNAPVASQPPVAPATADATADGTGHQIERFEIIRELGTGGHGVVYLAWDPAARRQVAIKTPHPEVLLNIEMRERFLREGVAAARLTHPNIVSVLEVGRSGPLCYIVSAYSDGQSLATLLENAGSGLSPRLAARWVAELADAVEHAHRHGVLHRDLKPGNVVLDSVPLTAAEEFVGWQPQPAGQEEDESFADLVPMLTDFGLAKLMDIEDVRTRTGALLGTPAYLAPEQVDPELGTAGPRSDVYGLGAILYECLTGQRLFESANQASLLRHIAAGDVTPPRRVHAELPRDLEAICLRALARRTDDRYASAAEMAADLRRYLACEVTIARPLNIVGRSVKWARRRPTASATLSVAVLALVALAVGALWHFAQLKSALAAGQLARAHAEQSERNLRQLVYFRDMQEAYSAVEAQDVRKASAVLSRYQPGGSGHEPGFLWRHLRARCTGVPVEVNAHDGHAHSVEFSRDGASLITAGADGRIGIWDATTGKIRATLHSAAEFNVARVSPDGSTIAAAESDGRLRLWDTSTYKSIDELAVDGIANVNCLSWMSGGRRIVAAGNPGDMALEYNLPAGRHRTIPLGHAGEVNALALSPDESYLASASSDGTVRVHCLADPDVPVAVLRPGQGHVTCVAFSPEGSVLATAGVHHSVRIWNVDGWTPAATYQGHADRIGAVAFSPRDPVVAFCDGVGVVRQWDWANNRVVKAVDGRHGRIMSAAYSTAGGRFATCGHDGSLCIWDDQRLEPVSDLLPKDRCRALVFTGNSRYIVTANTESGMGVFDMQRRSSVRCATEDDLGATIALGPIGDSEVGVVFRSSEGRVVFRRGTVLGAKTDVALEHRCQYGLFAVCPDGRKLISATPPAMAVQFWNPATGRLLDTVPDRGDAANSLACSWRGHLLAIGGNRTVRVWDLQRNALVREFTVHAGAAECVAFSSDDRILASGGADGQVYLWDAHSWQRLPLVLSHAARVSCMCFCPDEPVLVTGDATGAVRAWSLASGEELMRLAKFPQPVHVTAFSPDGQWLVATYLQVDAQETRVWHAPR